MKRQRENELGTQSSVMSTSCLINIMAKTAGTVSILSPEVFQCKTCNEGSGHNNHKRPKLERDLINHMIRRRNRVNAATKGVFSSINEVVAKVSVLKRSWGTTSTASVCFLDLNLTPMENDLKLFLFGKMAPKLHLSSF